MYIIDSVGWVVALTWWGAAVPPKGEVVNCSRLACILSWAEPSFSSHGACSGRVEDETLVTTEHIFLTPLIPCHANNQWLPGPSPPPSISLFTLSHFLPYSCARPLNIVLPCSIISSCYTQNKACHFSAFLALVSLSLAAKRVGSHSPFRVVWQWWCFLLTDYKTTYTVQYTAYSFSGHPRDPQWRIL